MGESGRKKYRLAALPPLVEPAHLSGPFICLGLAEQAVQSGDQIGYRPALLSGQDDSTMAWIAVRQRREVANVEGE